MNARLPVHQPGVFNIDTLSAGQWRGGANRDTLDNAIAYAKAMAAETGARRRVVDPDGNVVFDTERAVPEPEMPVDPENLLGFIDQPWELLPVPFHKGWGIFAPGGYRIAVIQDVAGAPCNAANAALLRSARELFHLARRYASECAECGGTGQAPDTAGILAGDGAQEPAVPCGACADIRAVLRAATTPAAPLLSGG